MKSSFQKLPIPQAAREVSYLYGVSKKPRLMESARCAWQMLVSVIAVALIFCATGIVPVEGAPLTSTITTKKVTVKEASTFVVTMSVTNTGAVTIPGVRPSSLALTGSGWAALQVWPSPTVAAIAPEATATFSLAYKAMLAGTVTLSGNALSPFGNSNVTSSPPITITGKKATTTKGAAVTDDQGYTTVKLGQAAAQLHFTDETTATPVNGLSVAAVVDKKNKARAVVAAVDSHGRYPIQVLILQGPSQTESASTAGATAATDPPTPVEVPVRSACDSDSLDWNVIPPMETPALPPLPPPPAPPIADDPSVPLIEAIRAAISSAMVQAERAVISTETVTCADALKRDLDAIEALPGEFVLLFPAEFALVHAYPVTHGVVLVGGTVKRALPFLNGARDVLYCGLTPNDELMIKQVTFLPVLPEEFQIFWHQPASEPPPAPLFPVAATASDPFGKPMTSGSLELLSEGNLGGGFLQALDSLGTADTSVPVGGYKWRVRAPGYKPKCGETTVTQSGAGINATLQKNPIASGTLQAGQLTNFLQPGATFAVTSIFRNSAGNPVACSGHVSYQVRNPGNSVVATVDQSGHVTMGSGCGAARITAWCDGIATSPLPVSTDCNGALPAAPPATFAVSPAALSFTAVEGGENPPNQTIALVRLADSFTDYHVNTHKAWIEVLPPNPPGSGVHSVSIDISGLPAGTYTTTIDLTDKNAPANRQSVAVTLTIQKAPPVSASGTWRGTWTHPVFGFCDETFDMTWHLTQSGTSVTGTYVRVVTNDCLDPPGTVYTGRLLRGKMTGSTLTILEDGGWSFTGMVTNTTIIGTGGGASKGPFSLHKQ